MPPCIVRILHGATARFCTSNFTGSNIVLGTRSYASAVRGPVSAVPAAQKDVLTALHRTNTILPKVLPPTEAVNWSKLLRTSGDILSGVTVRKPRIAVLGLDELSQPTDLISALLDDPLSSDKQNTNTLRNRRSERPKDVLFITHGEFALSSTSLCLDLPWLSKLDAEVVEVPATHPDSIPLLYDADVQVIFISPLSSALSRSLEPLLLSPNSFLILNYPTLDQQVVDSAISRLTPLSPVLSHSLKAKTLHVYPPKALSALDLFRQESISVEAVQTFQNDFLGSGMPALSHSICHALSSDERTRRSRHAQLVLTGALETCRASAEGSSREVAAVQKHIEGLQSRVHSVHVTGMQDVLGGEGTAEVAEAVERSTREVRMTMDALQWWKLPFKVDDLSETLSHALERAWCRDLEAKLHFQTGRLSSLRAALTTETHAACRLLPPSFHSVVLVNTLHQLAARPPDLAPNTLTYPLAYRLQQLQQPTLSLHRHAQRIMFVATTVTVGSLGAAYAAWFAGWIASPTAVGMGALGVMIGVRWLVGSWEKRKKRWWADWQRVGGGLERDLKNILEVILREKVTAVPRTAAEELEKVVTARLREIEEIEAELDGIKDTS